MENKLENLQKEARERFLKLFTDADESTTPALGRYGADSVLRWLDETLEKAYTTARTSLAEEILNELPKKDILKTFNSEQFNWQIGYNEYCEAAIAVVKQITST